MKTVQSVSSGAATFDQVSQAIIYNYQVTNTGTAGYASDAIIFDDQISPILGDTLCFDSVGGTQTFDQLDVVKCPATYTVTQADIDAEVINNTATADAVSPQDTAITDEGAVALFRRPRTRR